ncbi:MAG: hypothetical protein Q9197_004514, partial [Variospora fuerteventurae]
MRETKRSAVINLGIESLTLGNGSSEDPISQMPKMGKKGIDDTSGDISLHASSRVYARSWHPEQQVPSYQPLLVPPLGSNQSALSPSKDSPGKAQHASFVLPANLIPSPPALEAAQDLASLRLVPALAALNKQPKQHCIHRARDDGPPTPELQETSSSSRAPNSALTVERAPPPLGRWFELAPHSQRRVHPPKLRSPGLEYIVKPPPPPVPDPSYIARSAIPAVKLPFPQPLLLVLDLNGTLLYRPKASSHHKPRPALQPFLTHCISNYKVLIWSSATPHNVTTICSKIFTPTERKLLLGEWARDTLDLSPQQYAAKIQVYKRLDRIWNTDRIQLAHPSFATGGRWSQKNTLLLDDSVLKACAQPHNAVVVPEFVKDGDKDGTEVLGQVVSYLQMAVTHDD